jgi:LuxR family maltose regulon positive regulatory protein
LEDRPILAPALGAVGGMAIWMGEFDEGERWLQRAWDVGSVHVDPAIAVLLHLAAGMAHAGRRQLHAALDAFTSAAQAQALLTGAHALAPRITGWRAATQARLGMLDDAHATLAAFTIEPARMGAIHNARAVICLSGGEPAAALAALQDVWNIAPGVEPFTRVEAHLLTGIAHLRLHDRTAAVAAAEAALAAAEPDRLMFPFAMADAADLLDVLAHHETAHGALLSDIRDLLRGTSAPHLESESMPHLDELSPSEVRVLGYLPTNLTRPEIAQALHISINTVNTHIRNIYAKLGASDRSGAVQRARQLRLLSQRVSAT